MLGAAPALEDAFAHIQIDAVVGRQVQAGLQLLRAKRAAGALPDTVIVHLGNNGTFTDDQADALLEVLADVRRVVFVNLRVPPSPLRDAHPGGRPLTWHALCRGRAGQVR
jgi:hypothetical protein